MPKKDFAKQAEVPEETGAPAAPAPEPAPEAPAAPASGLPADARLTRCNYKAPVREEVYEASEAYHWQICVRRDVAASGSVKKTDDTAIDQAEVNKQIKLAQDSLSG